MNPQMNTEINPQMFAPSQYDQMASMYPGMDDPSLYMNTSATTTPLPNRPEIPSQNYNPMNQNYQADEDMYTAQLFKDGNTVSGWSVADDLDYAELGGGGDSIAKDMEYQKWLNDRTLVEQGNAYDDMAAGNPGMDGYDINEYDQMARTPIADFPQVSQSVANTQPNPYNPGPAEATGQPPVAVQAVEQSEVINDALNDLSKGDDSPSWWDKAENQQFLMQAASILLSDDIEEQQVSRGGGGGGGPPSPGTYSGGSSPAPKVVFGMGPYNGQGQQGYNPREIM